MRPLDDAIWRACDFLFEHQRPDGTWHEPSRADLDADWVSAYTTRALWILTSGTHGSARLQTAFDSACDGLALRQRRDGGWAHGPGLPPDADATAWALMSLLDERHRRTGATAAAVRLLQAHWDPDSGGFRTHLPPAPGTPDAVPLVETAYAPLPGVTGSAVRALALAGADVPDPAAVTRFVRAAQHDDGLWRCDLWTAVGNATYMAMTALDTVRGWDDPTRARACDGVVELLRHADGYDLAAALVAAPRLALEAEAPAAAARLVAQQSDDGGWPAPVRLRRAYLAGAPLPAPGLDDRLLTTATAAVALHLS